MFAIDTNVLIYAERLGRTQDPAKSATASRLVERLIQHRELVLPGQVLGEYVRVLRRKGGHTDHAAAAKAQEWRATSQYVATSETVFDAGLEIISRHGLQTFDALILAAAAEAGCALLLSEDMQDGFVWRGTTVANPFAAAPHPLYVSLVGG